MSVFALALEALFADPNLARDALYRADGSGAPLPVRVIVRRPDQVESYGETRLVSGTTTLELRASQVAEPLAGDTIVLDGRTLVIQGTPLLDALGLVWTLDTRPA